MDLTSLLISLGLIYINVYDYVTDSLSVFNVVITILALGFIAVK